MVAAAVGLAGVLGLGVVAAQEGPSATRSFSPTMVEAGGEVVVTIRVANYGRFGGVTETLPDGFAYVSSTLEGRSGQRRGTDRQVHPLRG